MKKFKALSLFSGAGIAEFGFKNTKVSVVLANELLPVRVDTHKFWHSLTDIICGDVTKYEIKQNIIKESIRKGVDFVFATPPCQGVSLIGKNKSNEEMLLDNRNFLIFHTFDIIDAIKPKCVLIENVARFFSIKYPVDGEMKTVEEIIRQKYSSEYNIDCQVFDAQYYGVPQHRERAIIRMWKNCYTWNNPKKQKSSLDTKFKELILNSDGTTNYPYIH